MPDGINVIHKDLFTADSNYSIHYEKAGNTSFKNHYYDMVNGTNRVSIFTWQGEEFVLTECEGCGMSDGDTSNRTLGDLQLHEYELDQSQQTKSIKINSRYRLLDLKSGNTRALEINTSMAELKNSVPAYTSRSYSTGADRRIYWVDAKKKLITIMYDNGN